MRRAPAGSVMRYYEEQRRTEGLLGQHGTAHIFPVPDTVCGAGLDVVGPGAGVFVADSSGRLQEFEGTSFSCPIVVGILANALATDTVYGAKRGRSRAEHARGRLQELCSDLKLPQDYQGWGLPILKSHPI
ncbi:hypothetical protein AJ87_07020 [Rhizobium yanglingense]|nr:hypothetical protein AJ87_07020 [Rhizobium yanglingense]